MSLVAETLKEIVTFLPLSTVAELTLTVADSSAFAGFVSSEITVTMIAIKTANAFAIRVCFIVICKLLRSHNNSI